jgi:hypothetical protein
MSTFGTFILVSLTSLPFLSVLAMMGFAYVHRIKFREVGVIEYIFSVLNIRVWNSDDVFFWVALLCALSTVVLFLVGLAFVNVPLFTTIILTILIGIAWVLKFLRFMNDVKVGRIVIEKNLD